MAENRQEKPTDKNQSKKELNIPKSVAVIDPPLKVELVSTKSNKSLPLWAQWLSFIVPVLLAIWALILTLSDNSQKDLLVKITNLIEKQDEVINEIKNTNQSIDSTQLNTFNLLQATLQQTEYFNKINQPFVRLRLKDYFSSPPGNDEQAPCLSTFKYYIENLSQIPAKNFSGKVGFIHENNGKFEGFYGYTSWRNELVDLTINNPITFGSIDTVIPCETAQKFYECFVVFAYSYQNEISGKFNTDTIVYKHNRSENYLFYFMKPLEGKDKTKEKMIIKSFLKGGFYNIPA
ncbi:hypothetical protein L0U88_00135 [Flavihumibacter sp. RY-1]|uniref:Uncharacterized protein n=1 Tax=Flavihumibacter fluminis TaxID=2909236 RepID=A0ABS9BDA3_9BACT|nr:hypothetical protein [Flavihumibacter fluminis]MCF1713033.1 hypothetical protein [Flavihumibacter fluminis]